jgi:hypothetical protein
MQKKIWVVGAVALLAIGLALSGCKNDSDTEPRTAWTGSNVMLDGNSFSATVYTTESGSWQLIIPDAEVDESGTYTMGTDGRTATLKRGDTTLGTVTIVGNNMSLTNISLNGHTLIGTLTKQ